MEVRSDPEKGEHPGIAVGRTAVAEPDDAASQGRIYRCARPIARLLGRTRASVSRRAAQPIVLTRDPA
jgi:hypothetical protein